MNKKEVKVVFIGSATFSIPILEMLIKEYNVQLVITEEDKAAGRGKKISSPPPKEIASQHNIACLQPHKVKGNFELFEYIKKLNPTVLVVAAYGKILPKEILDLTDLGCLNVHPSLLPTYRGPSPIQTALLNGDTKTGISIMKLTEAMDAGSIVAQEIVEIDSQELYESLEKRLATKSAEILNDVLLSYVKNEIALEEQNDTAATYCYKIDKLDGRINFNNSVDSIFNQYRAYHNWPGMYCFYKNQKLDLVEIKKETIFNDIEEFKSGKVFKKNKAVYVKCSDAALELIKVKLESKKEALVSDFVNGHQDFIGSILE